MGGCWQKPSLFPQPVMHDHSTIIEVGIELLNYRKGPMEEGDREKLTRTSELGRMNTICIRGYFFARSIVYVTESDFYPVDTFYPEPALPESASRYRRRSSPKRRLFAIQNFRNGNLQKRSTHRKRFKVDCDSSQGTPPDLDQIRFMVSKNHDRAGSIAAMAPIMESHRESWKFASLSR